MKSQKNGSNSPKMHPRANSQLPTPLKFGSEVLRVLMEMEKLVSAIMKNQKNGS